MANTPKYIRPICRTTVNWEQSKVTDEGPDQHSYAIEVGTLHFAARYKPGDWLIAPYICKYSAYYYQVVGYGIGVTIRYGFLEKDETTGVTTQSQLASAVTPGSSESIWYHLATYRRADHEMTDDITSVQILHLDYGNNWIHFTGPEVFNEIDTSVSWKKYYVEDKSSTLKK